MGILSRTIVRVLVVTRVRSLLTGKSSMWNFMNARRQDSRYKSRVAFTDQLTLT